MSHSKPRSVWVLLIPLLALPALWPLFANGLPRASDTELHMARLVLLHEHILVGALWPRWLPELTLGFGYLFFSYYAPVIYYVAEALQLVGFSAYHALQLLSAALIVGAGATMFFFARDQFAGSGPPAVGLLAALVAACAAIYNPYLLTNVYLRGAYGEAGAQLLTPLILLGVRRIFCGPKPQRVSLLLALSLAALALTHTLSLLFVPPLLLGYTLVLWATTGRDRTRLAWALAGFALAMSLSAGFWLPLLLRRGLVAETGADIARTVRLPASMWTWGSFLDTGVRYTYTFTRPVRLGLLQLALAIAGFFLARRRDGEWLYLGAAALVGAVLIGAWALPLWQNSPFAVVQFAWRLLAIVTLPLSLFAGGAVLAGRGSPRRALLAGAAILTLILFAQRPRLDWLDVFAPTALPDRASIAQLEVSKGVAAGGEQNSNIQEFRPLGAPAVLALADQPPSPSISPTVTVLAGSGFATDLAISAPVGVALRMADFYHPNWRVTMDDAIASLPTYASTSLSLLTVDVPPGGHLLRVRWVPSAVELAGAAVTLAAVAGVGMWAALRRRNGLLAILALALFLLGAAGLYTLPPPAVIAPTAPAAAQGLRLAGLRVEAADPGQALVRAWWQVVEPPPAGLRVRWIVRDGGSGAVVGESVGLPWFNTADAQQWPVGALVDDAYALPLPAGLPAGDYDLALELLAPGDAPSAAPPAVAHFTTPHAVPAAAVPLQPFVATIGDSVRLVGYDLEGVDTRTGSPFPTVRAGRPVELTLYWQTDRVLPANDRTFAHLFDAQGRALVKEDQPPGPEFHPTAAWLPGRIYSDRYLLHIPAGARGGLYAPWVGMVDAAGQRLPVHVPGSDAGEARLPPIKVVQRAAPRPSFSAHARFGDVARLTGYDLDTPEPLRAGDGLTVTLHLEAAGSAGAASIRFLQLLSAERAIVAQHDGPPAQINPTDSWLPGERILDRVPLIVDPAAASGTYTLVAGFYTQSAPDQRLPVTGPRGETLDNNWVELGTLEISP